MPPRNPEDWPHDFTQSLNAGDLDAVVALYDPDARFVDRTGEILIGRDRIRDILAGLINSHTPACTAAPSRPSSSMTSLFCTPTSTARRLRRQEARPRRHSRPSKFSAGSRTARGDSSLAILAVASLQFRFRCRAILATGRHPGIYTNSLC